VSKVSPPIAKPFQNGWVVSNLILPVNESVSPLFGATSTVSSMSSIVTPSPNSIFFHLSTNVIPKVEDNESFETVNVTLLGSTYFLIVKLIVPA
jgi:hypothetical protein